MAKAVGVLRHAAVRSSARRKPREGKVENHGLYLLMADPTSGVTDASATRRGGRRRNDAYRRERREGRPDVKFPKVDGPAT